MRWSFQTYREHSYPLLYGRRISLTRMVNQGKGRESKYLERTNDQVLCQCPMVGFLNFILEIPTSFISF